MDAVCSPELLVYTISHGVTIQKTNIGTPLIYSAQLLSKIGLNSFLFATRTFFLRDKILRTENNKY